MTEVGTQEKTPSRAKKSASIVGRSTGWVLRVVVKLLLVAGFVAGGVFIGGFLKFSSTITENSVPADIKPADAIVALTGGSARISKALQLLSDKKGKRLLISGVNEGTKKADIKNINSSYASLFECCVDLEHVAIDTVGNAREARKWLAQKGFSSVILVTSGYHMPRSLLEFRRAMPDVVVKPFPVPLEQLTDEGWWRNGEILRFVLSEYVKYVGAFFRDYLTPKALSALRGGVLGG